MKGVFFWQSQGLVERSMQEVAETLQLGGVDTLLVKANDGSAWMSRFDRGFAPVRGIETLLQWREALAPHGIRVMPWGNPRSPGLNEDIEQLAQMTAEIARALGSYDLDVEPGPMYWSALDRGDSSGVEPFFARLRELAPEAELVLDFPGSWAWDRITRLLQLAEPYVDRFEIQSYWTPAKAEADEARLRQLTAKPIDHIVSYQHLDAMLDWLEQRGSRRVLVWDFAHMSRPLYQRLSAFDGREDQPSTTLAWQEPGFAALARQGVIQGPPVTEPYPSARGDVLQQGERGLAIWVKERNQNFWVPWGE
jgi:hypothetical protein